MLLLARKKDEKVYIGENIEVKIIGIHNSQVLLGFSAPTHIPIHREEVFLRIQDELMQEIQNEIQNQTSIHWKKRKGFIKNG